MMKHPPIDPAQFRLPDSTGIELRTKPKPARPAQRRGLFLKGPVPMAWLRMAGRMPGKALLVGIEVWFQAGLKRSTEVTISLSRFRLFGVSRFAAARGLRALERAGLISVVRHPGRKPLVRILDSPTTSEDGLANGY